MQRTQTDPTVKKNVIKISFQMTGPGFHIRKTTDDPSNTSGNISTEQIGGMSMPKPIEPTSGSGSRVALVVAFCAAAGLVAWWLTRAH